MILGCVSVELIMIYLGFLIYNMRLNLPYSQWN